VVTKPHFWKVFFYESLAHYFLILFYLRLLLLELTKLQWILLTSTHHQWGVHGARGLARQSLPQNLRG